MASTLLKAGAFSLLSGLAGAQHTGAPAGQFDAWVFALEWQAAWNQQDCFRGDKMPVVNHATNDSYAASHLSLHGLWPQDSTNSSAYPQFCKGPQGDFTVCSGKHPTSDLCFPSADTYSKFNTSDYWGKYALEYAWSDLATHEWAKHGGCTGWDQEQYFQQQMTLLKQVEESAGAKFLTANAGKNVSEADIVSAFNDKAFLECGGHDCVMTGVWLTYSLDNKTKVPIENVYSLSVERSSCKNCDKVQILDIAPCSKPKPGPQPSPSDKCVHGSRGPACTYNKDTAGTDKDACKKASGCLRCAHSGHCTDVPLQILVV